MQEVKGYTFWIIFALLNLAKLSTIYILINHNEQRFA